MFQIIKFTISDRIYPIERTYMRIEDLLRPRQILRAVKVRAIWVGKEPCSLSVSTTYFRVPLPRPLSPPLNLDAFG